jgi:hypothetical protein
MTAVYSAVLGAVAVGLALLAGSSGPPADGEAVWLVGRGLFLSAVSGVAAVACAFRAAGRPVRLALLPLGLLPALVEMAWLAAH